jgi:chromosome partitioning protein
MDSIIPIEQGGYALLPANPDLTAAEVRLLQEIGREMKLSQALEPVSGMYDYIFIDCPPSINMLTLNALTAAHGVLIPIQCEYYALEGLSSLLETVRQIRNSVNPNIEIEGLLRTMYDPRNRLSDEVSAQLLKHFSDKVYDAVIPRNVRLAEAPSFGVPVLIHDPRSSGSQAYMNLAREIIRREIPAARAGAA